MKLSEVLVSEEFHEKWKFADRLAITTHIAYLVEQYEAEQSARDARVLAVLEDLHSQALIATTARLKTEAALRGEGETI